MTSPYIDPKTGTHYGYCNNCGEEAELGQSCYEPKCADLGEVVPYDDDPAAS